MTMKVELKIDDDTSGGNGPIGGFCVMRKPGTSMYVPFLMPTSLITSKR